jgi:hypothetical protein
MAGSTHAGSPATRSIGSRPSASLAALREIDALSQRLKKLMTTSDATGKIVRMKGTPEVVLTIS